METKHLREARIDLGALGANYAALARAAEGCDLIAVVKADAYGHGALAVATHLAAQGCRKLAVVTAAEAAELRAGGLVQPSILVLGVVADAAEARELLHLDATAVLHHRGQLTLLADAAREAGRVLPVQVEIDTAMRRMGVPPEEALTFIEAVAETSALKLTGVFTHFACADEVDLAPTREQLRIFGEILAVLRARGVDPGEVHVANSAGILAGAELPEMWKLCSAVRPGLSLYGVAPAPHLPGELAPVMHLSARVAQLRAVEPGDAVGYGATHRFGGATRVATLPIGYADGVPCSLGNSGSVLLNGAKCPIVGRVSMDSITVDVGELAVEIGDEVLLFGNSASGTLRVEEVAAVAGTIPYELLVRVGPRVPRVYTRE